jgi:asparagine synthase (glutamine-hydrolysing)
MAPRGPDDEGVYMARQTSDSPISVGLGHRRLSIIDLSPAGHQPMCNEEGSIWVTYNGEIYNFHTIRTELQRKGHRFKSDSDTEVILHLYEEEGPAAAKRFNGMFAFGVWDALHERVWLCRDPIGIKPLVYYWDGVRFAFASEIKALLCDPAIPRELDLDALQLYLTFSYVPAPYTMFKNIRKLPPGHSLILEKGVVRVESYGEIPLAPSVSRSEADFKKQIRQTLDEAVRMQMISDVPLGAFLSGGIDSSIIAALMTRHSSGPVRTFSIGFQGADIFDETRYAREVARHCRTDHHEFKATPKDMMEVLPDVLSVFDEPFSDSSAIPTFLVSRETRKHVTVALSGDGGDELFGGYRYYLGQFWHERYMRIPALIREEILEKGISRLPDARDKKFLEYIRRIKKFIKGTKGSFPERTLSLKEIFPSDIRSRILKTNSREKEDIALSQMRNQLNTSPTDPLNALMYADMKGSLPGDMLTKVDWMSMKNSLEVRVPFLDVKVAELAFQIPGSMKIYRGITKYILKETFRDLLPASLYHRPKAGFEVPISKWLKHDLNFLVRDYLSFEKIKTQGIFEYGVVQNLIQNHMESRTDTSWMLWSLIVFGYWHDHWYRISL